MRRTRPSDQTYLNLDSVFKVFDFAVSTAIWSLTTVRSDKGNELDPRLQEVQSDAAKGRRRGSHEGCTPLLPQLQLAYDLMFGAGFDSANFGEEWGTSPCALSRRARQSI